MDDRDAVPGALGVVMELLAVFLPFMLLCAMKSDKVERRSQKNFEREGEQKGYCNFFHSMSEMKSLSYHILYL